MLSDYTQLWPFNVTEALTQGIGCVQAQSCVCTCVCGKCVSLCMSAGSTVKEHTPNCYLQKKYCGKTEWGGSQETQFYFGYIWITWIMTMRMIIKLKWSEKRKCKRNLFVKLTQNFQRKLGEQIKVQVGLAFGRSDNTFMFVSALWRLMLSRETGSPLPVLPAPFLSSPDPAGCLVG